MDGYWDRALEQIAERRDRISNEFDHEDIRLWDALKELHRLEEYVRWCQDEQPPDRVPLTRLLQCQPATINAYMRVRETRNQEGDVSPLALEPQIIAELEEHGLVLADEERIHFFDENRS